MTMEITKRGLLKTLAMAPALATPALLSGTAQTVQAASVETAKPMGTPGFYRYKVGDIEITALLDGYFALPNQIVIGYDEKAARQSTMMAHRRFTPGSIKIPVNGYVIKTGKDLILLDAGAPSLIAPSLGGLTANMKAADIAPKDITTVLLTHTHPDHVGALANKDGSKVFENATLHLSEAEWGFIHNDKIRGAMPKDIQGAIDLARFALSPYKNQRQMFTGEKELFTGVTSVPLPGHTPGHTGFAIHSKSESLLIWGDIIHFSTLQFAHPEWGVVFDTDAEQAAKTRRNMFDRAAADQMAVAGMHVDFPGIGYVERAKNAYRYIPAPFMPV